MADKLTKKTGLDLKDHRNGITYRVIDSSQEWFLVIIIRTFQHILNEYSRCIGNCRKVAWGIAANHGGGYQYRLCPADADPTEECFQKTPLDFVGEDSWHSRHFTFDPFWHIISWTSHGQCFCRFTRWCGYFGGNSPWMYGQFCLVIPKVLRINGCSLATDMILQLALPSRLVDWLVRLLMASCGIRKCCVVHQIVVVFDDLTMFTPTKMEFEKCFRPESSELKPWCFHWGRFGRRVQPGRWILSLAVKTLVDVQGAFWWSIPTGFQWFHKGSARFHKKPQEFPVSLPVQLGHPTCCISITAGPIAENQLLHQLLQQTSFGAMLMALPQGHRVKLQGVKFQGMKLWHGIQTCFLFRQDWLRCEFYRRIFGYGGGHCFGNLTKKPDAACSLEAGKAAHENKVRWVSASNCSSSDPYWQSVFQPYTSTRDCSLKWRPVTFNGTS